MSGRTFRSTVKVEGRGSLARFSLLESLIGPRGGDATDYLGSLVRGPPSHFGEFEAAVDLHDRGEGGRERGE